MTEERDRDTLIEELKKSKDELEKKIEQLIKKDNLQSRQGGFGDYISKAQFYANVPTDPFAHQFMMVHRPSKEVKHPSDLLSPDILLSNIKDDRTMLLFQRDFYFLHRFFNLGQRSEAVMTVFNALYYPWEGQMRMTATLGGAERGYQSFVEPEAETRGFGFMKKITGKKKRKKGIVDYLHPQEPEVYE